MKLVLVVLGIACFVIDAFRAWIAPTLKINLFSLGWAFLAAAVLLPI